MTDFPGVVRTFQYQIAFGQLSASTAPVSPAHVIAPSLLTDNSTVLLSGGDAQWIVATKENDGNLHVLNQLYAFCLIMQVKCDVPCHSTDTVVKQSVTVASISSVINIIDNFLVPPGNLTSTLQTLGLTQFQANLQKAGLLDSLLTERGITLFAPSGECLIQ